MAAYLIANISVRDAAGFEAYRQAVAGKYRFYSYGDCMLLV